MKYKKLNRYKKLKPKKEKFWCKVCDSQLVGEHARCHVCGHRNNIKRLKKHVEPEGLLYCGKCKQHFDYSDIDDEINLSPSCPLCGTYLEEVCLNG